MPTRTHLSPRRDINYLIDNYSCPKGSENDADLIIPYVWLGNARAAQNRQALAERDITSIVNVSDTMTEKFPEINYLTFPLKDSPIYRNQYIDIMNQCVVFIQNAIARQESVLIHCKRGHHRSAALLAYYLMIVDNMSLLRAMACIKKSRPTGFRRMTHMLECLIDFEIRKHQYVD